jgi:hypothetical protein
MMLVVQLLLPPAAPPQEAPGLAPRRQRPIMVPLVVDYAAVLASPIFAPDRHPGPSGGDAGSGGLLTGYAALGAVTGREVATAVIAAPGGGVKTVGRGDEVDGWRMIGVDKTHVYFERNGVRHALEIGAPPEATGPAANAQPSGAGPDVSQAPNP